MLTYLIFEEKFRTFLEKGKMLAMLELVSNFLYDVRKNFSSSQILVLYVELSLEFQMAMKSGVMSLKMFFIVYPTS